MLSSQPTKLRSSSETDSLSKQRKKDQVAASNKLPLITRSADGKSKGDQLSRDESAIRPKSGPVEGLVFTSQSSPSPVKPLDFPQKKFAALISPTAKSNSGFDDYYSPISHPTPFISHDNGNDNGQEDNSSSPSSLNKNSIPSDPDTPLGSLSLSYVHGYDGDFTRNGGTKASGKNIFWLSDEIIVYPVATLVILLNIRTGKQFYYKSHTEEVSALTIYPNYHLVASGQMGKDSRLLIWETKSFVTQNDNFSLYSPKGKQIQQRFTPRPIDLLHPPGGGGGGGGGVMDPSLSYHREIFLRNKTRGVMALNFSPDGVLLVALGLEETKPIFIYDWNKNECLATLKLGHVDIFQIGFNPFLFVPLAKNQLPERISGSSDEGGGGGETPMSRYNPTKLPLEDEICCYSLITTMTRGVKFWTLRHVKERNDVVALASNGSQFKGRKIAIPKHKQSWSWKYVLEGNMGVFPKKSNSAPPDMTCYSIIPDESSQSHESGTSRLPRSKILTGGSNGCVYIWQQLEVGNEDTSREDYVPQYWLPRGRLLCVITGVHEGPLLDIDTYLTPIYVPPSTTAPGGGAGQQQQQQRHVMKYLVTTCGKDGILNLWELDGKNTTADVLPMEHVTSINVSSHSPIMGFPRSVQWCGDGHHLIVGTTGNTLCLVRNHKGGGGGSRSALSTGTGIETPSVTGNLQQQQPSSSSSTQFHDLKLDVVVSGHVGRINRVIPHPNQKIYVTIGTDKSIRLWSIRWSKQVAFTRVASNPTSISFLPDGSGVAVGTEIGELLLLTCTYLQRFIETGEEPKHHRKRVKWDLLGRKFIGNKGKGKEPAATAGGGGGNGIKPKNLQSCELTEMKYSPDGEYLAVASRDKSIHFLSVRVSFLFHSFLSLASPLTWAQNGYKKIGICKGHSGVITRIDWSCDSAILQSTDGLRESLMWEVPSGKQWSGQAKDFIWSSWSNPLGPYARVL
jgi:hypothetical protein